MATVICVKCGCPSPCETLAVFHIITAHRGAEVTELTIDNPKCQRCLLMSLEPYKVAKVDGCLQRSAVVGATELLVPDYMGLRVGG